MTLKLEVKCPLLRLLNAWLRSDSGTPHPSFCVLYSAGPFHCPLVFFPPFAIFWGMCVSVPYLSLYFILEIAQTLLCVTLLENGILFYTFCKMFYYLAW